MCPSLYSKDKKALLAVKKDPYYRGVINPAAKCCWGKLPIYARCNCKVSESINQVCWGNIIPTTDSRNASQFPHNSMGMKFPRHCVGISFPRHYAGMRFPQDGMGIKFPQTIRRNCILFIILLPGGVGWLGSWG